MDNPVSLPPWLLCHSSTQLLSLSGQDRPGLSVWKVTWHHPHPPTHHFSSHHRGNRPAPALGGDPVLHHTKRVEAARPKFCPKMSSSDHGCVPKNQDSSSQPCPGGTGNTELPVITGQRSLMNPLPNLCQKSACPIHRRENAEICATICNCTAQSLST